MGRVYTPLRGSGWSTDGSNRRMNLVRVVDLGYRWGVVETGADPEGEAWLAQQLGEPFGTCGALVIYDLAAVAPNRKGSGRGGASPGGDRTSPPSPTSPSRPSRQTGAGPGGR